MLDYMFPQGNFIRHDPLGLVAKNCEVIFLSWSYTHEKWQDELPYENSRDYEDVQAKLKSPNLVSFSTMTPEGQMEEINIRLVEIKRTSKEEE